VLIEVQNLSHVYAARTPLERKALRDVSLRIGPGERVGVVGRTGSGKSTLMQHLAGLLEPTSGRVLLDGIPAHARSAAARGRRRRVGMAFQYPEEQIFEQTVFREVAFGPRNLGLDRQARPANRRGQAGIAGRVRWALEMVGLEPDAVIDRSPFTLSGGEKRRVALASILAMQPDVLLLDEPTAGLDPRGREELLDHVAAWHSARAERRPTLVVVSHDLAALARLTDRAIVLQGARIGADGPSQSVLSDREELSAAGLRPPPPATLLHELREAGWPIRSDRLLPEEAAAEIAGAIEQGSESASQRVGESAMGTTQVPGAPEESV
jgi:energy-coupling factor transport system ATP-binding protein